MSLCSLARAGGKGVPGRGNSKHRGSECGWNWWSAGSERAEAVNGTLECDWPHCGMERHRECEQGGEGRGGVGSSLCCSLRDRAATRWCGALVTKPSAALGIGCGGRTWGAGEGPLQASVWALGWRRVLVALWRPGVGEGEGGRVLGPQKLVLQRTPRPARALALIVWDGALLSRHIQGTLFKWRHLCCCHKGGVVLS